MGKTSRLPANCGSQKLWMTSYAPILSETVRPTGTCNSLAVVRLYSGYRNSHHHWWPTTSMVSRLPVGLVFSLKIAFTVGTAIIARIRAGITVQMTSTTVFP